MDWTSPSRWTNRCLVLVANGRHWLPGNICCPHCGRSPSCWPNNRLPGRGRNGEKSALPMQVAEPLRNFSTSEIHRKTPKTVQSIRTVIAATTLMARNLMDLWLVYMYIIYIYIYIYMYVLFAYVQIIAYITYIYIECVHPHMPSPSTMSSLQTRLAQPTSGSPAASARHVEQRGSDHLDIQRSKMTIATHRVEKHIKTY